MFNFKNLFVDSIVKMIVGIYNSVVNVGSGSDLVKTLHGYNSNIYSAMETANTYISGVAYAVLAFFGMYALYQTTLRPEGGDGTPISGMYTPFVIMFKFVIGKILIDNSLAITVGLYDLGINIIQGLGGSMGLAGEIDESTKAEIADYLREQDIGHRISLFASIFVTSFIVKLSCLLVNVLALGRYFEIVIMVVFSPIPLATLVGENEIYSIGFSYLKKFIAVVLQGAVMYLVLAFFTSIFGIDNFTAADFEQSVEQCLMMSVVLAYALMQSSKWANAIVGSIG